MYSSWIDRTRPLDGTFNDRMKSCIFPVVARASIEYYDELTVDNSTHQPKIWWNTHTHTHMIYIYIYIHSSGICITEVGMETGKGCVPLLLLLPLPLLPLPGTADWAGRGPVPAAWLQNKTGTSTKKKRSPSLPLSDTALMIENDSSDYRMDIMPFLTYHANASNPPPPPH